MKWNKYSINTIASAEDDVVLLLSGCGIDAIEISDNEIAEESIEKEGGFYEELVPSLPEDDAARIIFYLPCGDENNDNVIKSITDGLFALKEQRDIGPATIDISVSDEDDWRDKWKSFFHAFSIGDIRIIPTWEEDDTAAAEDRIIRIDPGMSFGTGAHETTRMCIEGMQKYLKPQDEVLDVGCGSGILSIAALKLGAGHTTGTDIDSDCMESVASNFAINNLPEDLGDFYVGDLTDDVSLGQRVGYEKYDIVLANILADIIIAMKDALYRAAKPGGILISSGIIDFKEDGVMAAIEETGFEILERKRQGEWAAVVARKSDKANVSSRA